MRAGTRRDWLQIYPTAEALGTSGDVQPAWSDTPAFEVWSHKRTMSAAESTVAAARESAEDVVFEILYLETLTTEHRILCAEVYYDITGIRDPDGKRAGLHVYASSGKRFGA